jgi:hypothetical protein
MRRPIVLAVLIASGAAQAQQQAAINLAGVQIRNATNQSRNSSANPFPAGAAQTIGPSLKYHYVIDGTVHGVGGVLGLLYPNPTSLATVMEALSPGSSSNLIGDAFNCPGTLPYGVPPTTTSGSTTISGINVTYAFTLAMGIDAGGVCSFSLTNVTLSPSLLTGYLQFDTGAATLTREYYCPANCDNSTTPPVLNVNDFACFLNKFASADPTANCDCSTTSPVLNVNDFACFLNEFASGCP